MFRGSNQVFAERLVRLLWDEGGDMPEEAETNYADPGVCYASLINYKYGARSKFVRTNRG